MKKNYLLSLCFLLMISYNLHAQMHRFVHIPNATAQPSSNVANNNTANAVLTCSVDTITLTTQAQINNFSTNYPTCTNPKYLIINGAGASPAITSLAGLSSITQVIFKLEIRNTSITSLAGLSSLTQIGDTLLLERNNTLTSIGLNNLTQLGAIYFSHLPALTSVAGLSNNIHKTGLIYLDSTNVSNLAGLNNFDTLTIPNGGVTISNCPIINASALNALKKMEGYLKFSNNPLQTSIGLNNIKSFWGFLFDGMPLLNSVAGLTGNLLNGNIGTFWFFNTGITNLAGLEGLTNSSNFYISGNPNITSLSGLQNLSGNIGGGISMYGNPALTNITALSGITNVDDGTIEISYNGIATLNGLQNIVNIGKGLWLAGNGNLTTLSALNNNLIIQNNPDNNSGDKDSVRIYDNFQLALCGDSSLCNYFSNGGTAFIDNNAAGCNTIAEVQASCGPGINYNDPEDNCCTYNAIPIAQGQIKYGNVGHFIGVDGNGDPLYDDFDTYQIIMPYDGAFKLFVTAKNDSSCYEATSTFFDVEVLSEDGNTLQYNNLFNWAISDTCNTAKIDSFKFRGYRGDTLYLRLSGDKIRYGFSWQALDSTMTGNEFNNDVSTAYLINPLQTKKGNVGFKNRGNHYFDIYKTVLPVSANIEVYLKITNRENQIFSPSNRFHFDWGFVAPFGNFSNINYPLLPAIDSVIYDTIRICGLANDTMFFRLLAPIEAYEYEWSYKIKDTISNDAFEPNNNLATATPIAVSQTRASTIGYTGKIAKDNEDNFVTVLPQNGIMKIFVQATTNKCNAGYLNLAGLNKQQNYVFTRNVSGNSNIPTQTTVYDTILVCGQPADTFYFKFISNAVFNYQFRYEMVDPIPNAPEDAEPNNSFATAVPFNELDSMNGRLRFITVPAIDDQDYYRTVLPKDGAMNIILKTVNYNCGSNYVNFRVYDKRQAAGSIYFNQFFSQTGQIRYDTIKLCGLASDTFYVNIHSFGKFVYSIKYQLTDTSENDIEPNNSFASAITYNENDVKKGHIGYRSNGSIDYDYYRTVLPKDGTMKIIVQITNKNCNGGYVSARFYDRRQAAGEFYAKYIGNNGNVAAGQTIYDTILFCGRAADTFYLRYEDGGGAFNYEFKYQMIDTSTNDVEPNGDFATALPISENQTKAGHIKYFSNGGADDLDYYKTLLPYDGTLKIMVQATNMSCANGQWVYLRGYDRRQGNGQIFEKYIAGNSAVAAGQTVYDTLLICGRAADSFYLRFEATSSFKYQWSYAMVDTSVNDIEPNGDFATALPIAELQTKVGHIKYISNGGADDLDYYKTLLPKDGTLKIMVQATNMSCGNGQWVYLRGYDRRQGNGQIFEKYIAGNSAVAAGQTVYDTILICGRAADSFYLRFEATSSFKYQWSYAIVDTSVNDIEPNGDFATALSIAELQTKVGHIKYFSNGTADDLDYYKTLLPKDGTLKIMVQATNMSCANGQWVYLRGYDRRQGNGQIFDKFLAGNTNVVAGQTVYDTILVCGRAADSFYLRFEATSSFKYQWSYVMVDTSVNDIEPNNSFATAIGVGSNQTKNGHIKYYANGISDDLDYYKFIFATSDSLKLQMQATNMSCGNGQWIYLRVYNKNFIQLFERYFALNSSIAAGQTALDSIKMFVTAPDTIYLRYEATNPFKYQFTTNPRQPSASFSIVGDSAACFGTKTYKAVNVVDDNVVYNWALSGGGTLNFTDSIATVNWTTNGTHNLSLYLSNNLGNSIIKQKQVIVNNNAPTEVPVLANAARTLITSGVPSGAVCNWYKSGVLIIGVTDSIYYAQDSGTYTVRFVRPCGTGPASNSFYFPLPAQAQTITFTHTPNIVMSPTAKAKLIAIASSGLPASFQLISGNATIVGDSVYVSSVGTVIVKANQQGSNIYAAAPPKFDTIIVVQGPQTISFNSISAQIYFLTPLSLTATASSGLPVSYNIIAGNATISGNNLLMTGAGNVTVQAVQIGNANYSAATSVQQTFCIGVRTLSGIAGSASPCLNNYVYTTDKIPGANYIWTLSSGGTITTNRDTAFINWTTQGTHTITVKANSSCDAVYSNTLSLTITTANNAPTVVTNMLPINNAINQQLPLSLSWQPGLYSVNYDLYVWDSAVAQPALPYAANINVVNFTLPQNSFVYNKAYKWRIVSKNPCLFTAGPIQQFRLIPLPDLAVTQVLVPATAFSGQTIGISWTVKNNGPGRTPTNQTWSDAVYLSFDNNPNFIITPQTNPAAWGQLQFPIRPLLIGTRANVSALDSNQTYTNSINFTLPVNYSQPLYVYVITNNPANSNLRQITVTNDTARAAQPIIVTLSPTPDLRVDTVFAPLSTFSGSTVNVAYKVKNYGVVTPPNVGWYDKFYISPTANFNVANAVQIYPENYFGTNKYYNLCSGSYHALYRTAQLNADSSYTNSLQLVIPNFIYGAYFIHVFTNTEGTVYEGALNNNNTNSKQIQVFLTPTPVLEVTTLNVPFTNVSTTQPVGINWNINNAGIFDNIEKNQGHYAKQGVYCSDFLVGYTAPPNSQPIYNAGYYFTDSLGWGSSYWNEKIYLSKDSGNINSANLIYVGKYNHDSEVRQTPCYDYNSTCLPGSNNDRNIQNIIKPTLNYPSSYAFDIPDTLSAGNYYVYVLTNADKTVYEYPAINRYKRSSIITVNRPDLVPPTITVPANVNAGVPFSINYTISNAGPGNVFNHIRKDRIYVSISPVFDGSAQIISTQTFTENVLIGSPAQHNFTYTFPPGTPTSTRYFYVHTNYDSAFKETNLTNNRSAATATNVTIAIAKDLIVSSVQLPLNITDTVFTINSFPLKYTVTNNGTDSIVGKNWIDSIFVSCTPTFNASTAFYLVQRTHNNTLAAGQSYSDSFNFIIPNFSYELNGCFGIDNTNAYFFVRTNADTGVYEGVNMVNNYTASIQKKLINPYIDLIVTNVTGEDTATVARYYNTSWITKNIKYYTGYGYGRYNDGIYFSPDSVFNNNAILVDQKAEDRRLLGNQSMTSSETFILPNIPSGDYYVHVKTNRASSLSAEKQLSNNSNLIRNAGGAAKKIRVNTTPLPDITDSIVAAPTFMAVGQTYNVVYKIKNEGVGVSYPNVMYTAIYLSTTAAPGGTLLQLSQNSAPLQVGQFYKDSIFVTIPISTIPGNYVLVVNADNNGNIVESNENNNIAFKYVTVFSPAPSDLIVQNVSHPDTVNLGYTIDSLKWIVRNNSSNSAQGVSSDGLYLSSSNTFDSTATLIGIKNKTINMLPLSNDTLFAQPLVNNVTEGNYKVFVKTDFLNNIVETNKDNNTGTPIGSIYVKVKELPLNVLTTNTLSTISRYYKLIIPAPLNGSTILVTLKSNDSLTSNNQMYIGKEYIPSAANFDYKYDKPNYGNQDIVITTASTGTYYIMFKKVSATAPIQNVTIKAVKLPFAILTVQNGSGGNTGNVTIKIAGSLFNNSMTGRLYNGSTSIPATAIYFTNSTTVYATFNLAGRPLGIYNVELRKTTDSTTATLFNSFSIVPANNGGLITGGGINGIPGNGNDPGCAPNAPSGLNAQLVSELVLPDRVFGRWIFVIQINYNNPTNVDIPAQTRVLYCIDGFPIATTQAGVATGTSSLYIELTEPGGPPGIIRAGGSGTITLFSKASVSFPAHQYGNYILK